MKEELNWKKNYSFENNMTYICIKDMCYQLLSIYCPNCLSS